jgi:hypothetical protein
MAPRAWQAQPRRACETVLTQPSTSPWRSQSWVKSWSSTISSTPNPSQAALHQRVQGRQHPGGQAVRVDGDGQALVAVERGAQLARGVGPQGLHLAGVAQQHLARLGQPQRPLAHHQHMADIAFQRAQALRHRRLGDVQQLGGTVEAAGLGQGGQAFQAGGVQGIHGD